ncbi:MAG TPA: hypothetical protein PKC98_16000, partial [Candidatus Melainabacteria bacterium]|nr:hypothetical protein [Candidatus Melainabacteria bacterium]
QGATLCRGPVYTVYEVAGGPYPLRHWQRKIQFDLLQPPIWARLFDFIQSRPVPKTKPGKSLNTGAVAPTTSQLISRR